MSVLTAGILADTFIDSDIPDTNNNGQDVAVGDAGGGHIFNALLRFSRPALPDPNSLITAAVLRVYQVTAAPGANPETRANPILTIWVEDQVTWNDSELGVPWADPGMLPGTDYNTLIFDAIPTVATTAAYVEYAIPNVVQDAYDRGVNIDFVLIGSRSPITFQDQTDPNPPEIRITTSDPVDGPYTVEAVQPFVAGKKAGQPFVPGSDASQAFSAGSATAQVFSAGAVAAQAFSAGKVAAQPFDATAATSQEFSAAAVTAQPFLGGAVAAQAFLAGAAASQLFLPGSATSQAFSAGAQAAMGLA